MFQLNTYTALVTGASGGIGRAIATTLAHMGAQVILSGTRQAALEDVANSLKDVAHKPIILPCSLNDTQAIEALFPQAEEQAGKVDILVNNAGITKDSLIIRMKDEDWDSVLNINLTATFRLCRAAAKAMMKRRYGRIINISSVVATMGNAGQTNYCASKAGMIGLSKALAHEVASRGITVNCIAPGFIQSAMTHDLPEAVQGKILSSIPMGRMGAPEEIAAMAGFLATPEAAYITGQTLHVNGGMDMI
jgi:3-oxoacyl-[acyl-carrier protein] reductase